MTFAPALTSALVVSRPIPEYPPVTIAILLLIKPLLLLVDIQELVLKLQEH